MPGPYDDLLHLPHHVSSVHPPMPIADRAVQFAPFAALSGYTDTIDETARATHERIEPDETAQAALDTRLRWLAEHLEQRPEVTVTRFVPDAHKSGGAYVKITGCVKRLDPVQREMRLTDGSVIPMMDILAVEGEIFAALEDPIDI